MDRRGPPQFAALSAAVAWRHAIGGACHQLGQPRAWEGARATVVALLAHGVAAVISSADALDHLSDEALTDALTGLPNRRAWDRQLRQLSAAGQPSGVGMLDLDHFKQFNDTHGHPVGDRLLKETAAAWRDQLCVGDILARIGGEEFGLLLLGATRAPLSR
jgi:GGDEF domain-containing protein